MDDWNSNYSRFERNEDAYTDAYGQTIHKEHVDEILINDDNFMRNEWNYKHDSLANTESITAMYLDVIFISPSNM